MVTFVFHGTIHIKLWKTSKKIDVAIAQCECTLFHFTEYGGSCKECEWTTQSDEGSAGLCRPVPQHDL